MTEIEIIRKCIDVLNKHILPDSALSDKEALNELYGILDNSEICELLEKRRDDA